MKRIVLLLVLSLIAGTLSAQHHKKKPSEFDFTAQAGANFCQIDGDGSGHYDHIGYNATLATSFPLNNSAFRFSVGLGITSKGSHISNLNRSINLTYFEVPLMLCYSSTSLRIGAGFAPAFLAKSAVRDASMYNEVQSNNYRRMDILPFRAEAQYLFNDHWGLGVIFSSSLLNVAKEPTGTYRIFRSNVGQFNRTLSASIVYRF